MQFSDTGCSQNRIACALLRISVHFCRLEAEKAEKELALSNISSLQHTLVSNQQAIDEAARFVAGPVEELNRINRSLDEVHRENEDLKRR